MADTKKFTLGSIYVDHLEDYRDVEVECGDDEEAPQIYLKVPISIGAGDTAVQILSMCIWVNENALDDLQETIDELRSRCETQKE